MNLDEIQDLIKFVAKSGVSEVEIEKKDFKIVIKADKKSKVETIIPVAQPLTAVQAQPLVQPVIPSAQPQPEPQKNTPVTADESKYVTIKSPMIGTFYRSPGPDKPPFVNVGDTIKPGSVICIIEAMKLFNEIESEISGKIIKVLVDDAKPVEYDQPLFLVDPS